MDKIEVRPINNVKGKGLFAKTSFSNGCVIFEEDPLVCCQFSWNAAYGYRACDHCLRPLETAKENAKRLTDNPNLLLPYAEECCTTDVDAIVRCEECGLEYCSSDCHLNSFNQYHRTLCIQTHERNNTHPLEMLNDAWKQMHYPPETSTIMIIPKILAMIQQASNPNEMIMRFSPFSHRTVSEDSKLAHKLLGDGFANQVILLHNILLRAIPHDGIEQFLTVDGFKSLLALIGTNGQGVGTSAVSQWVTLASDLKLPEEQKLALENFIDGLYTDMDKATGNFLNNEGVALFSLQSACNHSCVPNAQAFYLHNNSRVSLMAIQDISPDEEICISYLDECSLQRSRHSRHKMLKENYLFVCECAKCQLQANDPDYTSEEEEDE